MLIIQDTKDHAGKMLSHFEDGYGNILNDLCMVERLVIVFTDGSKIAMAQDWRGQEVYWSQYEG